MPTSAVNLNNIDLIIKEGIENNRWDYIGAAKAIRAWSLQSTTDYHGEMILKQSNRVDPMARRQAYSEQGWTKFDHSADPYGPAEVEQERDRYRVRTL